VSVDAGQTWSGASAPPASTLALDATSANVIYLLGASGGAVYRSDDAGQTWTPTPVTNAIAIAADPSITGVVYTSAGQNQLLKSYDFGSTWTCVATAMLGEISALAVDPDNSNRLYAASLASGGEVFQSTDGGVTWQDLTPANDSLPPFIPYWVTNAEGGTIATVATLFADPGNSSYLYVLPKWPDGSGNSNGLFRSTNGGATWSFSPIVPGGGQVFSLGVLTK
jgi:photosystem II stability/assembly factor-like uncharacterized protein